MSKNGAASRRRRRAGPAQVQADEQHTTGRRHGLCCAARCPPIARGAPSLGRAGSSRSCGEAACGSGRGDTGGTRTSTGAAVPCLLWKAPHAWASLLPTPAPRRGTETHTLRSTERIFFVFDSKRAIFDIEQRAALFHIFRRRSEAAPRGGAQRRLGLGLGNIWGVFCARALSLEVCGTVSAAAPWFGLGMNFRVRLQQV